MNTRHFNTEVLQKSVLRSSDHLPHPGSSKWLVYTRYRRDFVTFVKEFYCGDMGITPDEFPYREDAVLELLSEYWNSRDEVKLETRHRLGMSVPSGWVEDPTSVLDFSKFDTDSQTNISGEIDVELG